jgi:hypothetical protein
MSYPKLRRDTDLRSKLRTVDVDLPEMELTVRLRELTAGQWRDVPESDNPADQLRALLALSIIDEDNQPIFPDGPALLRFPYRAAQRITDAFVELHGNKEQLAKKSEADLSTDSASN